MALLKTSPRRISHMYVDKGLLWLFLLFHVAYMSSWRTQRPGTFYMKRLFREHSHQKAKECSHPPGFAITQIFCLWWSKPLFPVCCRDGMEKTLVYVHKQGKKTFAKWCQYLQSTLVLALQIFRDQDLCYMAPQGHRGAAWALCLPHASEWVGTVNGFRHLFQVLVFSWYRQMIQSHSIAWLVIQRSKGVLKWKGSLCLLHWDQQSTLCCVLLVVKVSHGIYVGSACFFTLLHVVQDGGLHSLAVDHIMCSINFASCTLTLCSIKLLPVGWALRTAE